ncbi:phage tail protein [Enterobacter chuandaensis]|uniref:phage tail protein n=1 Tax=Enterobacter chuandaensis TaxID=2497875 RepID=UPI001AD81ACA|nr:phage tail protein [Enterobacter chuandaensis]
MLDALSFCRKYITKSFIWTSPVGETGLYRIEADSIKAQPLSSKVMTIKATFKQAYAPLLLKIINASNRVKKYVFLR